MLVVMQHLPDAAHVAHLADAVWKGQDCGLEGSRRPTEAVPGTSCDGVRRWVPVPGAGPRRSP